MPDTCGCGSPAVLTHPFGSTIYLPLCRQCAGGLWHEPAPCEKPAACEEVPDALSADRLTTGVSCRDSRPCSGMATVTTRRSEAWPFDLTPESLNAALKGVLGFLIAWVLLAVVGPTIDAPQYEVGHGLAREIGGVK